jgi:hypothetical protein
MRRYWRICLLAIVVLALADLEAASGGVMRESACPVPDSGTCAGKLAAGSYTTGSFRPRLTFTIPAGWANYLDIPGLYLLQPPGSKPPGNTIAGSFIGLETRVAPEAFDCRSRVSGVGGTPAAITAWIAKQHGLVITDRHAASVGGLPGLALDIRMARGAKGCLSAGATKPAVPLLVGVGPSSFDHEVSPGFAERHFLLAYEGGTLDIQIVDASRRQIPGRVYGNRQDVQVRPLTASTRRPRS